MPAKLLSMFRLRATAITLNIESFSVPLVTQTPLK